MIHCKAIVLKAVAGTLPILPCRPAASVQPVPESGAHAVLGAPLPFTAGPAGGLLGLPLLQPGQCRPCEPLSALIVSLLCL